MVIPPTISSSPSPTAGIGGDTRNSGKTGWIDLIDEPVHTSDDIDIGDIKALSRDFIVVKRGFVNVHYYYIPITKVEGWDGSVLWLKIPENEIKGNYERDIVPDPSRYYVKDYPYNTATNYPDLVVIEPRYKKPVFTTRSPSQTPSKEEAASYKCDLCNIPFRTQDELSKHVRSQH
jgi:Zinc finger, C2H2 type